LLECSKLVQLLDRVGELWVLEEVDTWLCHPWM